MNGKILLTSFQTWLPHQKSNASDDLLEAIAQLDNLSPCLTFLRQLPVDVPQAMHRVLAKIDELQPDGIICCGMAETRPKLTVESCATCGYASYRIRLYGYCLSICKRLRLKGLQAFLQSLLVRSNQPERILIKTSVDLENLVADLARTEISHDAGKFVCEGLYFQVLKYLRERNLNIYCIFVHVPVLTPDNTSGILADFQMIIEKMASLVGTDGNGNLDSAACGLGNSSRDSE
ncbi:MAG TPA: peptidase C15 [Coleofasciculaceae cyanobacterium]|jgi:pyroglutamyl-peptidase